MSREPDYYSVIQVDPRAEREVVEAAYRRLASKYHPDVSRSPEATTRMKQINAAYEVLSDPEKRRAYDLRRGDLVPWNPSQPRFKGPGRQGYPEWVYTLGMSVLLTVVAAGGSRFGWRVLILAGLLLALGWLVMSTRRR